MNSYGLNFILMTDAYPFNLINRSELHFHPNEFRNQPPRGRICGVTHVRIPIMGLTDYMDRSWGTSAPLGYILKFQINRSGLHCPIEHIGKCDWVRNCIFNHVVNQTMRPTPIKVKTKDMSLERGVERSRLSLCGLDLSWTRVIAWKGPLWMPLDNYNLLIWP